MSKWVKNWERTFIGQHECIRCKRLVREVRNDYCQVCALQTLPGVRFFWSKR